MSWFSVFVGLVASGLACGGKKQPLDAFVERQRTRIAEKSVFIQADFDFWAAALEPTSDDLEALRAAWVQHGESFPESKSILEIENEARKSNERILVVALFTTDYDQADLARRSQGWAVHPVPSKITELENTDQVLRRFMPVRNAWARYFLLRFPVNLLSDSSSIIVSNATSRIEFKQSELKAKYSR